VEDRAKLITLTRERAEEAMRLLSEQETVRAVAVALRMSSKTIIRIRRGEVSRFADDLPQLIGPVIVVTDGRACRKCGRSVRKPLPFVTRDRGECLKCVAAAMGSN
jgi:hypothetical protein